VCASIVFSLAASACFCLASASASPQTTTCSVAGGDTWTPPINVSDIRPTAVGHVATLKCRGGGGVVLGVMAGFLRSPRLACVAGATPESGVLTIFWNTGKSSKVFLRVSSVNATGHQVLSGKVTTGLFKGDRVKLDIQAQAAGQVGQCTDAAPLVSAVYTGSISL
jgi:hypothetical protein